jgi:3-deoxy-manno-octulosonate cytidylyltransferase (CMP-KDO synthetase)
MLPGVTCVVPARLGSTRFFGKLLRPLLGKPVIVHALERAAEADCFDHVICVTDSPEIAEAAAAHGFEFRLGGEAANGTERIARALPSLPGNLFVNLQGDEPAFPPGSLRVLCQAVRENPEWVHALAHADAPSAGDMNNPNRVKAAVDAGGFITAFARSPGALPADAKPRLQLGAYAYSRGYLERYLALPVSAEELELSHELLRAPGLAPIRAHDSRPGASVDAPDDLEAAERALRKLLSQPQARLQGTAP